MQCKTSKWYVCRCTDEKERLRMMTEIIAEIRQPIAVKKVSAETKKQVCKLCVVK
eukprot:m.166112 g.166112  ORF g.166112 m.166112 type:complete len:55 (+) comp15270_c0_seq8:1614-1778(+)